MLASHHVLHVLTKQCCCPRREAIGAPGMVVLQFAWGSGPNNVHLPHMHYENCFCYPGTHDNETSVGWFQGSANEEDKAYIKAYLGSEGKDIAWDFISAGLESVARTTVIMMQVGYVCECVCLGGGGRGMQRCRVL
jgi:4-alpha-glucanotransferase